MLTIQSLSGNHNRKEFDCGKPELNEWLSRFARQHQERDISQTFVVVDPASPNTILGFYALTACEVVTDVLPAEIAARLPRKAPGVRLGRLAVERSAQKQGVGELLLMDAIKRCCETRKHVGVFALFIDAKDEDAVAFYEKYGFRAFPDSARTLVLPLAKVCVAGK
jgi:GNAT superfamily N-acetyltransferase